MLKKITLLTVSLVCLAIATVSAETVKKMDLDRNGTKESVVYYDGDKITRMLVDKNGDGKVDTVVSYKNGHRDHAELDTEFNGRTDTWIKYYFTGVPAEIANDGNGDGRPDAWQFFKNGFIYKKEWDRNGDGKPDRRILADIRSDYRVIAPGQKQEITEELDDDYDGVYEKSRKDMMDLPLLKVGNIPGDTQQIISEK